MSRFERIMIRWLGDDNIDLALIMQCVLFVPVN